MLILFFFKQKTAYEVRPRDWSSDVCSSDLDDEHVNAGAMAMRLLVRTDAPERDVRFDRVVDHAKDGAFRAAAAVEAAGVGLTYAHVGDEVRRPLLRRRFFFKVALLGVVPVAEDERVLEDEFMIVERVDDPRGARLRDMARRIEAGAIVMLVPGVHGDREVASSLPLESLLARGIDPYRSRALTFEDINRLFEEIDRKS